VHTLCFSPCSPQITGLPLPDGIIATLANLRLFLTHLRNPIPPSFSPVTIAAKNILQQAGSIIDKVVVDRAESPTFQIAERIRQMIHDGELTPGMKLPPTRSLATQLSVDPTAVHRSLAKLVKEGLLLRTPRVGTFVAEPPSDLQRLAFYYRPVVSGYFSNFERAVLTEVTRLGHKQGFAVEVFNDSRKYEVSAKEPPPDLIRHTRTRWIQGVISGSTSPEQVKWFSSLTVPHATISTPSVPHTLYWRREVVSEIAVRQLALRGCRKIGMITTLRAHEDSKATAYEMAHYRGFCDTLAELKLPMNPDWLIGQGTKTKGIKEPEMAAFGFDAFNRIWDLPNRPDGLFLYPDVLATGALMAMAMRGIKGPQDLKVVMHANEELPIFCPFPVDRVVYRAADAANSLVTYIRSQLTNRKPPERRLQAHILPHP
jgi:DNA-binding LacI/PurR family transcriptional regulator